MSRRAILILLDNVALAETVLPFASSLERTRP